MSRRLGLGTIGRIVFILISLPLLLAGSYGLLASYIPGASITGAVRGLLSGLVGVFGSGGGFMGTLEGWLVSPLLRFSVAPAALVLIWSALMPARGGHRSQAAAKHAEAGAKPSKRASGEAGEQAGSAKPTGAEKRFLKKAEQQARALARKGEVLEAAELLFSVQHFDKAADYFIQAEEFVRAAELRHGQDRFIEAAELFIQAGRDDTAGSIFGEQGEYARAAECYLRVGSTSVAAEMYDKAGDSRRAGDCYREAEFLREAANAYIACNAWIKAAECLEQVYREENLRNKGDGAVHQELHALVRKAGQLYLQAQEPEKALTIFEHGSCYIEAAELAIKLRQFEKAAELFRDAGQPAKAAEALRQIGQTEEAALVLANLHRDRGESKEAAVCFEEAGDFLAAGDLYRLLEDYARAGECFQRQGEHGQAAEMFALAGDTARAADGYERSGEFREAADCYAALAQPEKQAELLERAGELLRAGRIFHQEGQDEAAIGVLQQLEPGQHDFSEASALLSDIFEARGQLSLAIRKLQQAIGDRELDRDSLPVFYSLASLYSANDNVQEAVEVFEKVRAFDYHYKDVEQQLTDARARLETATRTAEALPPAAAPAGDESPSRYEILGELGRGGMGIVYRAKDTLLDRTVAYKVLPDSLLENANALQNFMREAKAAAKLNHPNIVTVYDTGAQGGRYYIAMEFVDGTTLKEILRRRGPIAPAGILHVLVQICEALAYAHDKKVIHRDIKTANVMWARDKKAKLMDFGLAKVVEEVRNHTTVVSGTPYYMSPEQTLGKNVDHRTDIYSLGVTLFELATATVPFKEGNIPYHHVHTAPPDVAALQPNLPVALANVIRRCLLKDPGERYQTATEILDEMRGAITQTKGPGTA
jgi:tetratricopeptide (TPR) repeat protein